MPPMDEQIPGQPNAQQQFAQMLQSLMSMRGGAPGAGAGGGQTGMASPGIAGQVPNPPAVPQPGGQAARPMIPQATGLPGASEGGPGRFPMMSSAPVNQQTEFNTKGGRTAAIVQNALGGLSGAVQQYKQKQYQDKMQKAKAGVMQKAMASLDPAAQAQMDKLAKSDPKMAKIFQKQEADFAKMYDKAMTDPNSPEYYGFQQAYKELQAQAMQKDQMEMFKAQIAAEYQKAAAEQQRAAQEKATAGLRTRQTELEGTVTEKDKAEIAGRESVENIKAQAEKDKVKQTIDSYNKRTDAMIKVAGIRASALKNNQKGDDKTLKALSSEYSNISTQIRNLNAEAKALQDDVAKSPTINWLKGKDKEVQGKVQAIEVRRQALEKQLDAIEQKREVMLGVGALPPDAGQEGTGTETEPIVIP